MNNQFKIFKNIDRWDFSDFFFYFLRNLPSMLQLFTIMRIVKVSWSKIWAPITESWNPDANWRMGDSRNVIRGIAVKAKQRSSLQKFTSTYNEDSGYWFLPSSRKKHRDPPEAGSQDIIKVASTRISNSSYSNIQFINRLVGKFVTIQLGRNKIHSIKIRIHPTYCNLLPSTPYFYFVYP